MDTPAQPNIPTKIVNSAKSLDWGGWVLGMWSAFIVGATGAVGSAGGGAVIGVQGLKNYFLLMGGTFLSSGVIALLVYLHNHPTPQPWDGVDRRGGQ